VIVLRGPRGPVRSLEFSPDGRALVAYPEFDVTFWPALAPGGWPKVLQQFAYSPRFTPDGRRLFWLVDKDLCVYEIATEALRHVRIGRKLGPFFDFSPDGRSLLLVQRLRDVGPHGRLCSCPVDDPANPDWTIEIPWLPWTPPLFVVGDRLVTFEGRQGAVRYVIVTRRVSDGEAVGECRDTTEFFGDWATSHDRRLLAGLRGARFAVYRTDDFSAPRARIDNDTRKHFTGLAFHPSGRFLAATSNDNTVKFYDVQTWRLAHAFDWQIGRLRSVAFSPDGTLAAAGGDDGKVVVWDVDL